MKSWQALLSVVCLFGCADTAPEVPSYATDVQPILEVYCTRCHTTEGRRDGGVELDTYLAARSTRVSSVCTSVESSTVAEVEDQLRVEEPDVCMAWIPLSMPPGAMEHLSPHDQDVLLRWSITGAQP